MEKPCINKVILSYPILFRYVIICQGRTFFFGGGGSGGGALSARGPRPSRFSCFFLKFLGPRHNFFWLPLSGSNNNLYFPHD